MIPCTGPAGGRAVAWGIVVALALASCIGCGRSESIRIDGSDTMVNLAQAWAEDYHKLHPTVSIQVLGCGSGVGIASLIDGNCDLANASREMTPEELDQVKDRHGADALKHVVGNDALAIYVHKDNPLDSICLADLAEIYADGGKIERWSQLGVKLPSGHDALVVVNRQNSSGTYAYFKKKVLGPQRDYRLGTIDVSGSKDVVALVSTTPSAIGYSGIGYKTANVKVLKVSKDQSEPGVEPTVANANSGAYPITRPLLTYTVGQPEGEARRFLEWIKSAAGQEVVAELGFVPIVAGKP